MSAISIADRIAADRGVSLDDRLRLREYAARFEAMTFDDLARARRAALSEGGRLAGMVSALTLGLEEERRLALATPEEAAAIEAEGDAGHSNTGIEAEADEATAEVQQNLEASRAWLADSSAERERLRRVAALRSRISALKADPQKSRVAVELAQLQLEVAGLEASAPSGKRRLDLMGG